MKKLLTFTLILSAAGYCLADNVNVVNPTSKPVPVILIGTTVALAQLPASPAVGQTATVTDGAPALAWGATVTAGGTAKYLVWWNGAAWTVIGK
jgi:hypothetical protein